MKPIQFIVCALILFGDIFLYTEAGLFDPIARIFDPTPDQDASYSPRTSRARGSFLSPFREDDRPPGTNYHNNGRGYRNPTPWWNAAESTAKPIIENIFNDPPTTTPDYDKIIADRFPQATDLLAKLKELNKLKEQQKLQQQQGGVNGANGNKVTTKSPTSVNTPKPNSNNGEITTKKPANGELTSQSLTKPHFYFQAKPVRPEGQDNWSSETVYYN